VVRSSDCLMSYGRLKRGAEGGLKLD
jgi:hypothetical protein